MSSLPLDDQQQARHSAKQLAEFAAIMYRALKDNFYPEMADELMKIWFAQVIIPSMPMPDFSQLFKGLEDE